MPSVGASTHASVPRMRTRWRRRSDARGRGCWVSGPGHSRVLSCAICVTGAQPALSVLARAHKRPCRESNCASDESNDRDGELQ